jgi:hypothetical protein
MHPNEFQHMTLAYLMALFSYCIALVVEIVSLYMVSKMTDVVDVIQNFIQFEIILIFSEKAINLYKNSPIILVIQEPLEIQNFRKDKLIVKDKQEIPS